jgi:hypothetical protein
MLRHLLDRDWQDAHGIELPRLKALWVHFNPKAPYRWRANMADIRHQGPLIHRAFDLVPESPKVCHAAQAIHVGRFGDKVGTTMNLERFGDKANPAPSPEMLAVLLSIRAEGTLFRRRYAELR